MEESFDKLRKRCLDQDQEPTGEGQGRVVQTEIHRKRLPREEREKLILEEAVRFFAENGFEGQTRALADRLGVTQPLLYRYFPDKDSLIGRVFDEVYLKRWRPEWEVLLQDRSRPLADRLVDFYKAYHAAIFKSEFVRIFIFAGLKREHINTRYLQLVHEHIIVPVCREFRHEAGLKPLINDDVHETDVSLAWSLHGLVAQLALRTWVYGLPAPANIDEQIDMCVRAFILGLGVLSKQKQQANAERNAIA